MNRKILTKYILKRTKLCSPPPPQKTNKILNNTLYIIYCRPKPTSLTFSEIVSFTVMQKMH